MPKKSTAIWSMYHFHSRTPTTSRTIDATNTRERGDVAEVPADVSAGMRRTASRSRSMSRTGLISGLAFTRRAYRITYAMMTAVPMTQVTRR